MLGINLPLLVTEVETVDDWFEGVTANQVFIHSLFRKVLTGRIRFVRIDGLDYLSLMSQAIWLKAVSDASELLSAGSRHVWSEDCAQKLVEALLPDKARDFGPLLWKEVSRLRHFRSFPNGSRILTNYGSRSEQLVRAVLFESDVLLHFEEIAMCVKMVTGKRISP